MKIKLLSDEPPKCVLKYRFLSELDIPIEKFPWALAVEGMQSRLRARKTIWKADKRPTLSLDLRNLGEKTISFVPIVQAHCEIEIDGHWHGWAEPLIIISFVRSLESGTELNDAIEIRLTDSWALPKEGSKLKHRPGIEEFWGEHLVLKSGKHTVRVRFRSQEWMESYLKSEKDISIVSNPVEIEILPAERPDMQVDGEGVGKRISSPKPFKKGQLPPEELLKKWAEMLNNSDAEVRLSAVKDMWKARHESTTKMLLSAVSDPDPKVSEEAMYLVEMNQKLGIHTSTALILELLNSGQPFHRTHGARLMDSHHKPEVFYEAATVAASDSDGTVREWAFVYFRKQPPPDKVIERLLDAVVKDPVWRTRAMAAETLYHLGIPEAASSLMTAIKEGKLGGPAFHALISCGGNPQTIAFLEEQAISDSSVKRRSALGTIALAGWFPLDRRDVIILKAVNDSEADVRTLTYEMIGRKTITVANRALCQKIASGEDVNQEMLFFALSRIADRESGEVLLQYITKKGRIAELALEGVAHSGNDLLVVDLLQLIGRESDKKKKEKLGSAVCQILINNPNLKVDDPGQSELVKVLVKEESSNARFDTITLFHTNLAVVNVSFFGYGERWLLRKINGQWEIVVRFQTWIS